MASFNENLEFTKGPPSKRDGVRILCCNYLYYANTEFKCKIGWKKNAIRQLL